MPTMDEGTVNRTGEPLRVTPGEYPNIDAVMGGGEGESEKFDALAAEFYRDTGMLPLGKDDPRGIHTRKERSAAWALWLAAAARVGEVSDAG